MKWLDKLKSMSPASGRKITEDGEIVNIADIHDKSTSEFGEIKVAERTPLISLNGVLSGTGTATIVGQMEERW